MNTKTYIFHHGGVADNNGKKPETAHLARLVEVPRNWTSDQWGDAKESFADEARCGKAPKDVWDKYAYSVSLDPAFRTPEGLTYQYDLCRDGGMYQLYAWADKDTEDTVKKSKEFLHHSFDVVTLDVIWLKTLREENQ